MECCKILLLYVPKSEQQALFDNMHAGAHKRAAKVHFILGLMALHEAKHGADVAPPA